MGADGRVEGLEGKGLCPSPEKKNFYLKQVGFGAFYNYFFTFMQKLVRSMGAAAPPPFESAIGLCCM